MQYKQNKKKKYQDVDLTEKEIEKQKSRAKQRSLYLLQERDLTKHQLIEKLKKTGYCQEAIDFAVSFVVGRKYVDDEQYVRNYVAFKNSGKTRKQMEQDLVYKKGVSMSIVKEIFAELDFNDESEMIVKYMRQKGITKETDFDKKQKFIASMLRKGFSMSDIRKALDVDIYEE